MKKEILQLPKILDRRGNLLKSQSFLLLVAYYVFEVDEGADFYFYNSQYMNRAGAELFLRELACDLKKMNFIN